MIGEQDVGQWLVEQWLGACRQGWSLYVEAGEKAQSAKKGIFGSAPNLAGISAVPAAAPAPQTPGSILEEGSILKEEGGVLKPADQPAPAE